MMMTMSPSNTSVSPHVPSPLSPTGVSIPVVAATNSPYPDLPPIPASKPQEVDIATFHVSSRRSALFSVGSLSTGIVVVVYDSTARVGGIAYTVLADEETAMSNATLPPPLPVEATGDGALGAGSARSSKQVLPLLWERLQAMGASKATTTAKLLGGSQLFTFGGGGGNPLNTGSRNAITCRTVLGQLGIAVSATDVGGNRPRQVHFSLHEGHVWVQVKGGRNYLL